MIVVGVDGSDPSDRALKWAASVAHLRDRPLRIIYAAKGSAETGNAVVRQAAATVNAIYPSLPVETAVVPDNPAHALIAASTNATMVVVGNRGHGGFHDLLLGSTSLHTAMHAKCPVTVVRPPRHEEPHPDAVDRIVVGVDGSPHSEPALEFAFEEAELTGRGITAVHAWQGDITAGAMGMPYVYDPIERQAQAVRLLEETLARWMDRHPEVDVRSKVEQMPAAAALVDHSRGAHEVVAGSRGLGGFTGAVLGSVSQALIHHASCPVVIAHQRETASSG
ncbi:MAG TPA: universal stress protein UspA [Micromonosporaceae bacterium]|nr:universal stress protein UspA [Micromonosporaceae bacterium]HCU51098.1 universal stress protein UspA [Micromonosporaceae bacterium]